MPTNSIKGFKVGNEVKKYDYNELDNLPENDPDDLAEEISDLKSDLGNIDITYLTGHYIATSGATANVDEPTTAVAWDCAVVDCTEGDVFTVTGSSGSSPRLWAFVDANNNVLTRATDSLTGTNIEIVAPYGATRLVLNARSQQAHSAMKGVVGISSKLIKKADISSLNYTTPEFFGAVGDGSTDDTAALQRMFESDYTLFVFGNGKTYLTYGIYIPNKKGFHIIGNGATLKWKARDFSTTTINNAFILNNAEEVPTAPTTNRDFAIIENLFFDGNKTAMSNVTAEERFAEVGTALRLQCFNLVQISNCTFRNCFADGVSLLGNKTAIIEHCSFYNIGNVSVFGTDTTKNAISANFQYRWSSTGQYVKTCDTFICRDNYAENIIDEFLMLMGIKNSIVENNTVQNLGSIFAELYTGFNNGLDLNIAIRNNNVINEGHSFIYCYYDSSVALENIKRMISVEDNSVKNLGYEYTGRNSGSGLQQDGLIVSNVPFHEFKVRGNRAIWATTKSEGIEEVATINISNSRLVVVEQNYLEQFSVAAGSFNSNNNVRYNNNSHDALANPNTNCVELINNRTVNANGNTGSFTQNTDAPLAYGFKVNGTEQQSVLLSDNELVGVNNFLIVQNGSYLRLKVIRNRTTKTYLVRTITQNIVVSQAVVIDNYAPYAGRAIDGYAWDGTNIREVGNITVS